MSGQLEAALRTAMSPARPCPAVEEIAVVVLEGPEDDLAVLETHAVECANCAAEIALARLWEQADEDRDDLEAQRVKRVVQQVPPPARRSPTPSRWSVGAGLAAAALALLVFGLPRTGPPPLPERNGSETSVRSQEIVGLAPVGELGATPTSLSWDALAEARSYRVVVERVDGDLVHSGETSVPSYSLRGLVTFEPHVRYVWRVEAVGRSGLIAVSEEASLQVAPPAAGR